jgi:putative acetyltransferase
VIIAQSTEGDAEEIARIHLAARKSAMPYLPQLHSVEETLAWFVSRLADAPDAFWIARDASQIIGYLALYDDCLDDLYVHPDRQGLGVGSALLETAKSLSPNRLLLSTFEPNIRAQAFYVARGFREVGRTDGLNQEQVPDIQYEWTGETS